MKDEYVEAAAYFKRATKGHQVSVVQEDGLYRHLRFQTPGNGSSYGYDLITWPYNLVIRGGWTFAFAIDATEDMFDLFRRTSFPGEINPSYWEQKVVAGRDEVESFSEELLRKEIEDTVQQWERDDLDSRVAKRACVRWASDLREDVRKDIEKAVDADWRAYKQQLREAVDEHFFDEMGEYNLEYQSEAYRALNEFSFMRDGDEWPHAFSDWHEWRLTEYSPGFLWACHAIRHGIDLYDAARKQVAA